MGIQNLISLLGIFGLVGVAYLLSTNKKAVHWPLVGSAIVMQLVLGAFVFILPQGRDAFWWLNNAVVKLLGVSTKGSEFVFGSLAKPPGSEGSLGFFLAFQTLPAIIFFSALISILYYIGFMPLLIRGFARIFTKLMRISGAESLVAASNIFVGVEANLAVKPHLNKMTESELCTILTAGMATVASNVMAFYVFTLQPYFPAIAGHLISASILSAPAAILMSKVLLPETGQPETLGQDIHPHYERESNVFEAVIKGAQNGLGLIAGILALLIAVLGLVALFDLGLGWVSGFFGQSLQLQQIFGWVFYPFTLLMGVPLEDAAAAAKIIGERLVVTEFVAYMDLAEAVKSGALQDPRSLVITSYALCGFAHFASLSIFIGGVASLAPERTKDLSRVGLRALLAANLACLCTGCVAGLCFYDASLLFG